MQGANKIRVQGVWSIFLRLLFASRTHQHYAEFLRKQGFKDFLRIPLYTMRHGIKEVLVQQFHVKIGTFHLSYGEYAILPLYWTAILGIRFGRYPIPIDDMSFEMACKLLGIPLPLTTNTKGYFGPITSP